MKERIKMQEYLKKYYIFPLIYLISVGVCIFFAFNYKGSLNPSWWLVLSVLTFPWSLIVIVFIWVLIHGAGLEFFTVMYLLFAVINCYLIYRSLRPKQLNNKNLTIK